MKIDRHLNLVIPILDEAGKPVAYVHSTPLATRIWDMYWEPLSMAFTRIMTQGHGSVGGPRIADKMLQRVATELGVWDTPAGVKLGVVAEIERSTSLLQVGARGWEMVPFFDAKKSKLIEEDDVAEIEAALVFFTLVWFGHRKQVRGQMLEIAMSLWGAQIESSSCTEFLSSLTTLTQAAASGEKTAA